MVKGMGGTRPVGGFFAKSDVWQHCTNLLQNDLFFLEISQHESPKKRSFTHVIRPPCRIYITKHRLVVGHAEISFR